MWKVLTPLTNATDLVRLWNAYMYTLCSFRKRILKEDKYQNYSSKGSPRYTWVNLIPLKKGVQQFWFSDTLGFSPLDVWVDPLGRYVLIKGHINNLKYTIASVYLPPTEQLSALKDFISLMNEFREGTLVIGGDFNIALEPKLDSSTGLSSLSHKRQTHSPDWLL